MNGRRWLAHIFIINVAKQRGNQLNFKSLWGGGWRRQGRVQDVGGRPSRKGRFMRQQAKKEKRMRGRRPSPIADKLTRRVKPIYCQTIYRPIVFNYFDFINYYRFFKLCDTNLAHKNLSGRSEERFQVGLTYIMLLLLYNILLKSATKQASFY